MQPQYLTVPGQAVLNVDCVELKVSLMVLYRVSDPALAIHQVADYRQGLYVTVQNSLRESISKVAMDVYSGIPS